MKLLWVLLLIWAFGILEWQLVKIVIDDNHTTASTINQ